MRGSGYRCRDFVRVFASDLVLMDKREENMPEHIAKLKGEIERLRSVIDQTWSYQACDDLPQLFDAFVKTISGLFPECLPTFFLVDQLNKCIYPYQDEYALAEGRGILWGEGIHGWVAANVEPLLLSDLSDDERFLPDIETPEGIDPRTAVVVPIMYDRDLLGVVALFGSLDREPFDEYELEQLISLAHSFGISWHNLDGYIKSHRSLQKILKALITAIDARIAFYVGHSQRVASYCHVVAERIGLDAAVRDQASMAGLLHDVGMLLVPHEVLSKKGKLSVSDLKEIRKHPRYSFEILKRIPEVENFLVAIKHHHEWYSGEGYPDKIQGDNIPLLSRIINVCDAFDAMTSDRPYRRAHTDEEAIEELVRMRGKQFDPWIVDAFQKAYDDGRIISQDVLKAVDPYRSKVI